MDNAEQIVKAKYPDATLCYRTAGYGVCIVRQLEPKIKNWATLPARKRYSDVHETAEDAWADAAARIQKEQI